LRLLAGTQNCSLVGPVKSGKTSLLLHLARPGTLAGHGLPAAQHSAVYLSFEGLGTLTPEQFFDLVVKEIARQTTGKIALVWPRLEAREAITFLELKDVLISSKWRERGSSSCSTRSSWLRRTRPST
jgi:hypothetical protein